MSTIKQKLPTTYNKLLVPQSFSLPQILREHIGFLFASEIPAKERPIEGLAAVWSIELANTSGENST